MENYVNIIFLFLLGILGYLIVLKHGNMLLVSLELRVLYYISKFIAYLFSKGENGLKIFTNLYTFLIINIRIRILVYYFVIIFSYNLIMLLLLGLSDIVLYNSVIAHAESPILAMPLSANKEFQKEFLVLFTDLKNMGLSEAEAKNLVMQLNNKYGHFYSLLESRTFISSSNLSKFKNEIYLQIKPFSKRFSTEDLNIILLDWTRWFEKVYNIPLKYHYFADIGISQRKCMFEQIHNHSMLSEPQTIKVLFEQLRNELLVLGLNKILAYNVQRDLTGFYNTFIIKSRGVSLVDRNILFLEFMDSVGNYLTEITKNYKFDKFQYFAFQVHIKSLSLIFLDISYLYEFTALVSDVYADDFYTYRMYRELESLFFCKYKLSLTNSWTVQDEKDLFIAVKKAYFYNVSADTRRSENFYTDFERRVSEFFKNYYLDNNIISLKSKFFTVDKGHYAYKLFYKRIYR